jgi:hypothetical protein
MQALLSEQVLRSPQTIEIPIVERTNLKATLEIDTSLVRILENDEPVPEGHHAMRILTVKDGDKRLTWIANSLAAIQEAKKAFLDLVKQGLTPYRVGAKGEKTSQVMKEFDPKAEEVVFVPTRALAGG